MKTLTIILHRIIAIIIFILIAIFSILFQTLCYVLAPLIWLLTGKDSTKFYRELLDSDRVIKLFKYLDRNLPLK